MHTLYFSESATLNHFILNMHIRLDVGGLLMVVKMGRGVGGGGLCALLKDYGGFA